MKRTLQFLLALVLIVVIGKITIAAGGGVGTGTFSAYVSTPEARLGRVCDQGGGNCFYPTASANNVPSGTIVAYQGDCWGLGGGGWQPFGSGNIGGNGVNYCRRN